MENKEKIHFKVVTRRVPWASSRNMYWHRYICTYLHIYMYGRRGSAAVDIVDKYLRKYIYTCIHIYIFTYIHVYMYTCIHIYIYTYVQLYKYGRRGSAAVDIVDTHIHIYIYTFTHIYIYTYIHTNFAGVALQQLMDMVGNTPELCKSLRTEAFRLHKVRFCVYLSVCVCVCVCVCV